MLSDVYDVRGRPSELLPESSFVEPIRGEKIELQQRPWEFGALLAILSDLRPRKLLEIGTFQGGSLFHTMQATTLGAEFVAVDLLTNTGQYPDYQHLVTLWGEWADRFGHKLIVVTGDSHQPQTREAVRAEAPFDFLYIDADHDYPAVRADFEDYGPLVRPGGIIAFHDIGPVYGVHQLWAEIQHAGYITQELCSMPIETEHRQGIGVLRVGAGVAALATKVYEGEA